MTHLTGVHLQPWKNWCNDPNGLYYDGEFYHAFYQHYPYAHAWGPMHWGHAKSKDLYHWDHLPIAIFPDDKGFAFSGSAYLDHENLSGLGQDGQTPILLYYTQHQIVDEDDGIIYEHQSLAYSLDGVEFKPYNKNYLIDGTGRRDFRDPSIYKDPQSGKHIMSLACGDHIEFYISEDLLHWSYQGKFRSEHPSAQGLWECPALVPLSFEGETIMMLIVSYGLGDDEGRARTKYFLGDLVDGVFTARSEEAFFLDGGPDYYAAVPFHNTYEPIVLAWALNWGYADKTPTEGYCGQFNSPRGLRLYKNAEGELRVSSPLLPPPSSVFETSTHVEVSLEDKKLQNGFLLTLPVKKGPWNVKLSNDQDECVTIEMNEDGTLIVDRSKSGFLDAPLLNTKAYQVFEVQPEYKTVSEIQIFVDGPLIEVLAKDGTRSCTMVAYPKVPYDQLRFYKIQGEVQILKDIRQKEYAEPFLNRTFYR